MTSKREIRLNFLDVDTHERCTLNGDIVRQINSAGSRLCAQGNTYGPLFRRLYTPEASSATKIKHDLRWNRKIVDS